MVRRARRNRSEIIFPMEAIMSNTTPFLQRLADWNQGMNDVPRRLLIIAAVALACYIAVQLFPFCWPFVLALVFASLMEPVARLLRKAFKRFKAARSIATLLCMLLLYGLITILFFTITDKLVRECISLARALPDLARAFVNQLTLWVTALYEDYAYLLPADFIERVSGMLTSMVSNVASWAANITGWIASFTISTVSSLPMIILSVLFTIMATFYFSYDKERIAGFFRSQFPSQVVKDFRLIKGGVFTAIFGQVRAQIFISFVLMLIIIAGLLIMHKPYALLLGMLIGVADVLPVIGAGLFLNTWAIGALIIGDYYTAIGLFIIYLVTVTVRQIIEPRIVGKQLGLYPLVTMMSMFAGFQIMGTLGLIAGPLVANICKVSLDADAGKLEPGTKKSVLPWGRLWDSLRRKNKKSK